MFQKMVRTEKAGYRRLRLGLAAAWAGGDGGASSDEEPSSSSSSSEKSNEIPSTSSYIHLHLESGNSAGLAGLVPPQSPKLQIL
ncbi:hypothetical protein JCGZ_05786 [Jatropha curcas]|uniref:Uncharacterized protein n=1 Tax=Jatropha curcas TaxID=180498 RepID=A0A067KMT2_JATCU|nr:hypothetical protein JCGZ_05786 [Jatropha curcas]